MSDQYDQEAEGLLPCQRPDDPCQPDEPEARKCHECFRRPAVATRLRADGRIIAALRSAVDAGYKGAYEKAQREFAAKFIPF